MVRLAVANPTKFKTIWLLALSFLAKGELAIAKRILASGGVGREILDEKSSESVLLLGGGWRVANGGGSEGELSRMADLSRRLRRQPLFGLDAD